MPLDDIIPGEYLSNRFSGLQPSPTPIPEGELRAYVFHHQVFNPGVVETVILSSTIEDAKRTYVTFRKEVEPTLEAEVETIEEKRLIPGVLNHVDWQM